MRLCENRDHYRGYIREGIGGKVAIVNYAEYNNTDHADYNQQSVFNAEPYDSFHYIPLLMTVTGMAAK
jgi:hypothetical protein